MTAKQEREEFSANHMPTIILGSVYGYVALSEQQMKSATMHWSVKSKQDCGAEGEREQLANMQLVGWIHRAE